MGKCTFKGGVHPFDGKELSKDKPIKELFPEGDMVYPLSQHIGAPAVPASLLLRQEVLSLLTFIHLYQEQLRLLSQELLQQVVSAIPL